MILNPQLPLTTQALPGSPCPECGAQSSAPGYAGHANGCHLFYADLLEIARDVIALALSRREVPA
jgi:hypothetical protein